MTAALDGGGSIRSGQAPQRGALAMRLDALAGGREAARTDASRLDANRLDALTETLRGIARDLR